MSAAVGSGVESMTKGYGAGVMPAEMSELVMENEDATDCLLPMGITSASNLSPDLAHSLTRATSR